MYKVRFYSFYKFKVSSGDFERRVQNDPSVSLR